MSKKLALEALIVRLFQQRIGQKVSGRTIQNSTTQNVAQFTGWWFAKHISVSNCSQQQDATC